MHLYDSELYMQDVCAVASMIEVQELADASVLISGGTGMIGSFLVDALCTQTSIIRQIRKCIY